MKIDLTKRTSSSFYSSAEDLQSITTRMMGNERLLKLLKYPVKDALHKENLTPAEKATIINNNIRVIPSLETDSSEESIIIINFDSFTPNANNPVFRDNLILIDVLCPTSTWVMDDYMLRPYRIMHEIDLMINNTKLAGIGKVQFLGSNNLILSNEISGFSLSYRVINDV